MIYLPNCDIHKLNALMDWVEQKKPGEKHIQCFESGCFHVQAVGGIVMYLFSYIINSSTIAFAIVF